MSKILRYLACLAMLMFVGNALAAYDNCSIQYTSCKSGYYMSGTGAGNSCNSCTGVSANGDVLSSTNITGGKRQQVCTGNHTGGAGGTSGSGSCSGCSSSTYQCVCNSGYHVSGSGSSCTCVPDCSTSKACSSLGSGWQGTYNECTGNQGTQCYKTHNCTGDVVDGSKPSGCSSGRSDGSCGNGNSGTYREYYGGSTTSCSADTCYEGYTCTSASSGYYLDGGTAYDCGSSYPYSSGGDIDYSYCYKNDTCYGSVVDGSRPSGCSSGRSDGSCGSGNSGTRKHYSDGTYGSCSASTCYEGYTCTSASSGYYLDGGTARDCGSTYPYSSGGNIDYSYCYKNDTCYGSVVDGSKPSGCSSGRSDGSCGNGNSGTRKHYSDGTYGSCNASTCYEGYTCTSASDDYYLSNGSPVSCPSSYPYSDGGNIDSTYCYTWREKTGSQNKPALPSGCASYSLGSCTPGTCDYKYYSDGSSGSCTASSCTKPINSVTADDDHYVNGKTCPSCPSGYPNSDGGSGGVTQCYSNSKSRSWTGSQVNGSVPTNCSAVTEWNSCSKSACSYVAYANSAGTGDGTIKSGCSSNSANCTKTVKAVSAKSGYYDAGTSCSACPSGYPNSKDGNTGGNSACYISVGDGKYVGTKNSATLSTCAAGTYKAAHNVYYGSTSSCSACTGRTKYSATGAAACSTVTAGHYTTGCNSSNNNCTGQSECGGNNYYCSGGVRNTVSGGYYSTGGTATTRTGQTQCEAGYYCASGVRDACDGATQYQNEKGKTSCKDVSGGYYKSSNSAQAQCPENYRSGAGASAQNQCKTSCANGTYVATANAACTSVGTGYYRAAHTVNYGSTSTRTQCPANYRSGAAAGSQNQCKTSCEAGEYVATANAACTSVGTGYYRAAHTVNYGSTSTRSQCPANYRSGAAAGAQNQCKASCANGTYVATANSACTAVGDGYYRASHTVNYGSTSTRNTCPSGYPNSDAGASAITNCYSDSKSRAWTGSQNACSLPSGCSSKTCNSCSLPACNYVAYANSAGTGDGTIKSGCSSNNKSCNQTVASVKASAGHRVSGTSCPACAVGTFQGSNDSTATSCSVCAANTYASSTGMSACTSCPSGYVTSGTAAANHDAKSDCTISCQAGQRVTQADAQCSTPSGSWYTAAHTVAAGSTTPSSTIKACLTNYATPNTTTRTDHDASNDCRISCAAGTRIASANATSCTTPAGNWYVGPHSVAQGSTSSVSNCLANYTISGTAASNHDAANDCKISCGGGSYIAQANATSCSAVGAGYWAAASTISQGSAGVRNQCDAGLTTIGSGAGADEEDDCGRVLNFNGEKIYLRSGKKTTPSLNVGINGTTFYGNLGTGSVGSLRIKSGSTTYSVYDDSMQ